MKTARIMTTTLERSGLLALLFATALLRASDAEIPKEPVCRWLFDSEHVKESRVTPQTGSWSGRIQGPVQLRRQVETLALRLDGKENSVLLAVNPPSSDLPGKAISLEAWVALDKAMEWGGIIGALQDNGDYEKGWLLGYRKDRFCLAVSGKQTDRLTYLTARNRFVPGQWHHVVGTYDGATQRIFVDGRLEGQDTKQRGEIDYPPTFFYEIGAYHDDDELYRMEGFLHEVSIFDRALTEEEVAALYRAKKDLFPAPFEIAVGPFVEPVASDAAVIRWETRRPLPSIVAYGAGDLTERVEDLRPKKVHKLAVRGIEPETVYSFAVRVPEEGKPAGLSSKMFHWDSTFNYTLPTAGARAPPYPRDELSDMYASAAEEILRDAGIDQGYCIVLEAGRGRLAFEIARRSRLKVVALEKDPKKVAEARRAIDEAGLYGPRVAVHRGSLADTVYGDYLANLIVSDAALFKGVPAESAEDALRVLRPCGGTLYLAYRGSEPAARIRKEMAEWFASGDMRNVAFREGESLRALYRRPKLSGAGEWTHQYGLADNSACSKDDLVRGRVEVLWWGRPGPRPMPDRGPRNPAPVSANGRLFVQGNRILFGIDAYNGTILWSFAAPTLRRSNMPRDAGNMVASDDYLYVSSGGHCIALDAQTGERRLLFSIPENSPASAGGERPYDWGYVGRVADTLLGSAVKKGSAYLGDDGEWFDGPGPEETAKVTSEFLFAVDRQSGDRQWRYRNGVIVNSTITASSDAVYFIESRSAAALASNRGRLADEISSDQFLVALDLESGSRIWEKRQDFSKCRRVMYLAHERDTLVVLGSSDRYHVWAFDARRGDLLWSDAPPWKRDHHGGAIQHPVIVANAIYSVDRAYDLRTGRILRSDLPERRGCGSMSASTNGLFYRHHFHSMWDLESNERTEFQGIRSGCWIGIIPANGVLLAPETSSGCFCTHAIQISVAYVPKKAADPGK